MTNMASTRPGHTMGTATCSWNGSTCITTRRQVNFTLLFKVSELELDYLISNGVEEIQHYSVRLVSTVAIQQAVLLPLEATRNQSACPVWLSFLVTVAPSL